MIVESTRVGRRLQIDSQRFLGVQLLSPGNQRLSKVGIDSPISPFVGLRQRAAGDTRAKARVVQLGRDSSQAGFDVAKTLAPGELRKGHAQKLVATGETSRSIVAAITPHAGVELVTRNILHQLREDQLAREHASLLPTKTGSKKQYSGGPD
jgi:hypothetical protein